MISPAPTTWPPKRFTPRRWALLSRPFLLEPRPFLCAIASPSFGGVPFPGLVVGGGRSLRVDRGDLDLCVVLAVTLALAVAGLVLVLEDVDLGALRRADDLDLDVDLRQRVGVGRQRVAVDDQHGRQREAVAGLVVQLVDLDDITDGDLHLPSAVAHDRVHRELTSSLETPLGIAVVDAYDDRATTNRARWREDWGMREHTEDQVYGC